ncbi:MAG: formylglycine-generating enzyme family protein [Elusimicrobia bacterium]|nr:formylglycine-generating enzyme family protein [Elusimicrobiota bacterium]
MLRQILTAAALLGCFSLAHSESPDHLARNAEGAFQAQAGAKAPSSASGPAHRSAPIAAGAKVAAVKNGSSKASKPADALDESKVGFAARFVSITAGDFRMGSPSTEADRDNDETRHPVRLTNDFEIQATEVTQLQYYTVTGRNPSSFSARENCDTGNYRTVSGVSLCANHPVESVSWDDAQAFINELNNIQETHTYRLPTEAEWEYAARAGTESPYSFGTNASNELDDYGWHNGNSNAKTHAVAAKNQNPWRLFDMHGNVREWTQDFYDRNYGLTDLASLTINPTGPTSGSLRAIRGGSWHIEAKMLRSADRYASRQSNNQNSIGFRLVRTAR